MRKISLVVFALLIIIITIGYDCVFEEKLIDLVVTENICAPLKENHDGVSFNTIYAISYSEKLDTILADNGLSRDDIVSTSLVSASYEVTSFKNTNNHDWKISGSVSLLRNDITDGPESILEYTDLSIEDALDKETPAILDSAGVSLLNRAFDDYFTGGSPSLVLAVKNASVKPVPDSGDPIVFEWKICLVIQIVVRENIEVPDPF